MFTLILFIYFVSFLDKQTTDAPALSPRALEQRTKWQIPTDISDIPVNALYLDSLRHMGVTVHHTSRWFNGATCEMDDSLVAQVAALSFVTDIEMTRDDSAPIYGPKRIPAAQWTAASEPVLCSSPQLQTYNLLPLHDAGYQGQGIVMAICDGAFYRANSLSCFRQSQELGHFDFTDDGDDFYGSTGPHGTQCLSAISGIKEAEYYGAATQADYYLMRSEEDAHESPKEMDNLVAALEKADSLGVNVFSVSLGYALFDNDNWTLDKYNDLDGVTTRCSRAATIAARKGMLVCVAAGNEGTSAWGTISAPCDADSILTVGAVTVDSIPGSFSSYGPSSDGRTKPEVCAVGVQTFLINSYNEVIRSNGTSFATPLLAGLAASLWSALPDENAMQIRERIIRSAHLYPNTDPANKMGYGIPDAWTAYTMTIESDIDPTPTEMPTRKILRGDQILIIRHGHIYNLAGQRVDYRWEE